MQCAHWNAGTCRSCTWLATPYPQQITAKEAATRDALAAVPHIDTLVWLPTVLSADKGFRTKAKLVVGGTPRRPSLGALGPHRRGVDLHDCPVQHPAINATLPRIKRLIRSLRMTPYDVPTSRGELKYVHVTVGEDDTLMLRFVLRSHTHVPALRAAVPDIRRLIPRATVITANIHPRHEATVEGAEEIILSAARTLTTRVGGVRLHLGPQAFSQTNTDVAGALYRQAAQWTLRTLADTPTLAPRQKNGQNSPSPLARTPETLWDLYCGVGGFALHAAAAGMSHVSGVEVSADAISSARRSARDMGIGRAHSDFRVGDAYAWACAQPAHALPDVIVVNPPRRGIGPQMAHWLDTCGVPRVIYSSCNPTSLARDLLAMPHLRPLQGRLFDMFAHTSHAEVALLLERTHAPNMHPELPPTPSDNL